MAAAASPAPNTTASITVLMDSFDGKRLNSPNDVVVKSDGSIWFTDPAFGILGNYEGYKAELRDRHERLPHRRRDRQSQHRRRRRSRAERPVLLAGREDALRRGIARRADPQDPGLRRFSQRRQALQQAHASSTPVPARPTACAATSTAICGAAGAWAIPNSTASWSSRPTASTIGRIALPERCANLCFGGRQRNRLFMAASQSIYALYVNTQGALGG